MILAQVEPELWHKIAGVVILAVAVILYLMADRPRIHSTPKRKRDGRPPQV